MTASTRAVVCSVPETVYRRTLEVCERVGRDRGERVPFDEAVREGLMFWLVEMTRHHGPGSERFDAPNRQGDRGASFACGSEPCDGGCCPDAGCGCRGCRRCGP